jgi:hypothetical protein
MNQIPVFSVNAHWVSVQLVILSEAKNLRSFPSTRSTGE